MANRCVILESRGIVSVTGADAREFLQGLISQDINRIGPDQAAYGAFLTPQGKYLHDFCIAEHDGILLLDCEAARADDLATRLARYRLRADVAIAVRNDLAVAAIFGDTLPDGLATPGAARTFGAGILFVDPRNVRLGCRAILPATEARETLSTAGFEPCSMAEYDALRVAMTVPDGSRDLEVEKTVLLEANFDTLNGIDWQKGCYLGQELTARTKYRGLVKRRLYTIAFEGPAPAPGTPVERDGKQVGIVHSVADGHAIATLRLEEVNTSNATAFRAGNSTVRVIGEQATTG